MNAEEPKREDDDGDSDRDEILARRRVFVTSALAGLVMSACDRFGHPVACLSPIANPLIDASVSAPPSVCLQVVSEVPCLTPVPPQAPDAAPSAGDAAATEDAHTINSTGQTQPDASAPPRPCLRRVVVPPHPCLTPMLRHCLSPIPRACLSPPPNVCLDFKSTVDDSDEE